MVTSNPKEWARKNKKLFANRVVTAAGVQPHDEPAAFFMAGLPGAGKTEFTESLISDLKLKAVRIDMDEIATQIDGYQPQEAHAFREAATDVLNAVFDRATHRRVDFIMDGTFRSSKAINNLRRCAEKGYHIKLFYVHQEPLPAWEFTVTREKVEKRHIDKAGFIDSYFEIFDNLKAIEENNIPNLTLDFVVKDKTNKIGRWHENIQISEIDELIGEHYNRGYLERILPE